MMGRERDPPRARSPSYVGRQGGEAGVCPLPLPDREGRDQSDPWDAPPRTLQPWASVFTACSDELPGPLLPMAFQGDP